MTKNEILDDAHWEFENHSQKMPFEQWRQLLLNNDYYILFRGCQTELVGKEIGFGIVEVSKKPYKGKWS